jgi:hypothetical protein
MFKTVVFSLVIVLHLSLSAQAQKLESYKAPNGVEYHIGDTVKLGQGSSADKRFVFVQKGGIWADVDHPENNYLSANFAGWSAIVKKIMKHETSGKMWFIVDSGTTPNPYVLIDQAIAFCEVVPCKQEQSLQTSNKYDDLKKLKDLLDSGAITQSEYDKEKAKILEDK